MSNEHSLYPSNQSIVQVGSRIIRYSETKYVRIAKLHRHILKNCLSGYMSFFQVQCCNKIMNIIFEFQCTINHNYKKKLCHLIQLEILLLKKSFTISGLLPQTFGKGGRKKHMVNNITKQKIKTKTGWV